MSEKIYRNIQKLGGSYALSLPKTWIDNNSLSEPVSIDPKTKRKTYPTVAIEIQSNGSLLISPDIALREEESKEEVVLEADQYVIWELLKKSLAGETKITILSEREITKGLRKYIKMYVNRLPNTEIIEETKQKIVVQNFGYKEVPTKKLIQRLLYIVANMFDDLKNEAFEDLDVEYEDLKKFYFILVIHIRTYLRTGVYISSSSDFTPLEAMDYRMFCEKIEEIGEILRDLHLNENILEYYDEVHQYYNEVMDAFLTKNDKLAFIVWITKDKLFTKAEGLIKDLDNESRDIIKSLMRIAQDIKDMAALI